MSVGAPSILQEFGAAWFDSSIPRIPSIPLGTLICAKFVFIMKRFAQLAAILVLAVAACLGVLLRARAQDDSDQAVEEVVVNQAAGRVVIAVVKGAILIGTAENQIEPGTHPPIPVNLSSVRAGVLLGAVDWTSPSLQKELGRLDHELPQIRSYMPGADNDPHLSQGGASQEASDIEAIGKPLKERLGALAGDIHSDLDWPSTDPVLQLVLADYVEGYGPEVWQLSYALEQEQQMGDYWVTNIGEPTYLQYWPPEKGDPRSLIEFDYPQKNAPPSLLDLLRQKDPRLQGLIQGDAKMADTANKFLAGDSMKILPGDATQFLRAALGAITPPNVPQTMAIIKQETGFDWILAPPPEPKAPQGSRPSGAPSLAHPESGDSNQAPSLAHPQSDDAGASSQLIPIDPT